MADSSNDPIAERRLSENEVAFKQLNQQINKGYKETNRIAREDGQLEYVVKPKKSDAPLYFFCECADEKCGERVSLNAREYDTIHKHPNNFVIIPGHEVTAIEEIVQEQPGYTVVRKNITPPKRATKLNPTSLDNA